MWSLTNSEGKIYYLRLDQPNIVGRNSGDIILSNDKSISRKHASICVSNNTITVEDYGSTYGTYLNENISLQNKIEAKTQVSLKDKDIIKFGLLENEWVLSKQAYATCTSTMTVQDKKNVEVVLKEMGLSLCNDIDSTCTHLTMSVITLTIKVVLALVSLKPIVTPEYWSECLNCFKNNKPMPDHKLYLPVVKESTLNEQTVDCNVNVARKELFSGKTIIFFSRKQKNLYQKIIETGGGCCYLLSERSMKKSDLCQPDIVLIQYVLNKNSQDSQVQQTYIDNILDHMNSKDLRVIPETEIGLAILFCSLDIYCNPAFSFTTIVKKVTTEEIINKNVVVLAPESQDKSDVDSQSLSIRPTAGRQVNETIASSLSTNPSGIVSASLFSTDNVVKSELRDRKTRKASPLSSEEQPRKKFAHDKTQQNEPSELFQFVSDKKNQNEMDGTGSKLSVSTFKSRKPREVVCNSEDLFNFLPNVCEDVKPSRPGTSEIFSLASGSRTSSNIIDNNLKRKRDGSNLDIPDGKRMLKDGNNISIDKSKLTKQNFDDIPWRSTKTIKKEKSSDDITSDASSTSDVESKLRDLDMKPAVVIVNETLLKREKSEAIPLHQPVSHPQANYKKFIKVQPLRPQNEVIPRSEFSVYEGMVRKAIAEMDLGSSDEADDANDDYMSFNKPKNKPLKTTNGRVRRL